MTASQLSFGDVWSASDKLEFVDLRRSETKP